MGISIRIYHAGLHQIELEEEKWGKKEKKEKKNKLKKLQVL